MCLPLQDGQTPRPLQEKDHARVRIGGKAYWLGRCPDGKVTRAQHVEAARLWHRYVADGKAQAAESRTPESQQRCSTPATITVGILIDRFLAHAEGYYRRADGTTTSSVDEIRLASRSLADWAAMPADSFGPKMLKAVQDREVRRGRPRVTVNRISKTIRRAFKWAAGEEIVSASVWHALQAVPPIQKGRSEAPELAPVEEVPEWVVEATLPHVSSVVAGMIMLQRWTGMRPGEVAIVRPCDIDRSGDVWLYRPFHFKTDWRAGAERIVAIGPEGQRVLEPFLQRPQTAFCSSRESPRRSGPFSAEIAADHL
jgi:integrase